MAGNILNGSLAPQIDDIEKGKEIPEAVSKDTALV